MNHELNVPISYFVPILLLLVHLSHSCSHCVHAKFYIPHILPIFNSMYHIQIRSGESNIWTICCHTLFPLSHIQKAGERQSRNSSFDHSLPQFRRNLQMSDLQLEPTSSLINHKYLFSRFLTSRTSSVLNLRKFRRTH